MFEKYLEDRKAETDEETASLFKTFFQRFFFTKSDYPKKIVEKKMVRVDKICF